MNELPRVGPYSSFEARSASGPIGRKLAAAFLATFMASAMIVWYGFLGWEVVALVQWVLHLIGSMWSHTR